MPKYIIKFKKIATYQGYINISEEEFKKLSKEEDKVVIDKLKTGTITAKMREVELEDFYPLY